MNILNVSKSLSQEESKSFIAYLRKKNRRTDTKNEALFKLLRSKEVPKDIDILLYGKPNRNAYHVLSKRLHDALIDFMATQSFETETSEDMHILKTVLAGRILYEKNQPKAAYKLLQKATQKARLLELYSVLTEIYHTQIQYAHLHPEQSLEKIQVDFQENLQHLLRQENLNLAYAHLRQNLVFKDDTPTINLREFVLSVFKKFNIDLKKRLSFKSLFQLMELLNKSAHLESNFEQLLPLFNTLYQQLEERPVAMEKHRFYHIQVLYFMANAYFRNWQFKQSLEFLSLMGTEMTADGGRFEARFRENFLLLLSLNLNYTADAPKAITFITTHLKKQKTPAENPDLLLALLVYYTQQEQYREALGVLRSFRHSDTWYEDREGKDWLIRRDLLELIIHFELENVSVVESLLRRFKRKYKSIIKTEVRLERFIKIYSQLYNEPIVVGESSFRESVKTLFATHDREKEDLFMLSYFAWIKAKIDKKPLYETTLALLNKN